VALLAPATGSDTEATGLPEGRSRLPAARQRLNAVVPGDDPPALGVSGTGPVLAALPLPWYREPLSGCPCWPPAIGSDHRGTGATGLPEDHSDPAACQLLNRPVPGDGLPAAGGIRYRPDLRHSSLTS
jgi:hypothetical protein